MATTETKQGMLAEGRITTGRDCVAIPWVPALAILYIEIVGGTATVDIEISDDPEKLVFFPLKTVTDNAVVRISVPASILATNVTAISGATVNVRYRLLNLADLNEDALATFLDGVEVPDNINITGFVSGHHKVLTQTQPSISPATIYTVPASTQTEISLITVANTNEPDAGEGEGLGLGDATITIYVNGTTPANLILPASTIVAGGQAQLMRGIKLSAGDTIAATASEPDTLTVTLFGSEQDIAIV